MTFEFQVLVSSLLVYSTSKILLKQTYNHYSIFKFLILRTTESTVETAVVTRPGFKLSGTAGFTICLTVVELILAHSAWGGGRSGWSRV